MKDKAQPLGRREFNLMAALAALSGVAITVTGCSDSDADSDSPTSPQQPPPAADRVGAISANHGHSAVITGVQLTAGNALMLNIQGQSDHPHTVELSAAEIDEIGKGRQVAKESSTVQFHRHTVTFN